MNNASLCVSSDMWFVHLGAEHEVWMFPLAPHTAEMPWKFFSSPCSPTAALTVAISLLKWAPSLAPQQVPWERSTSVFFFCILEEKVNLPLICTNDVAEADGFSIGCICLFGWYFPTCNNRISGKRDTFFPLFKAYFQIFWLGGKKSLGKKWNIHNCWGTEGRRSQQGS